MDGIVVTVSLSGGHFFSKANQRSIRLIEGLGVEGDAPSADDDADGGVEPSAWRHERLGESESKELLRAVEADGLLIPQRIDGQDRYSREDVAAARAGLLLLEWGIPLSALLDLARRHHQATEALAENVKWATNTK